MKSQSAFTLVELMVVVLTVGILAAVAIPNIRGRIDAAKWSEGRAIMGTIATSIRAYVVEKDSSFRRWPTPTQLGFASGDLDGSYFKRTDLKWIIFNDDPLIFLIWAKAPKGIRSPRWVFLDHNGNFTEWGS